MTKRIIFSFMMLFLVFVLFACGGGADPVKVVVPNNPVGEKDIWEKLVFDHTEANSIVFKGDNGLSYWTLSEKGIATLVDYDGTLPTNVVTDDNGVRTYTFTVSDIETSFKLYVMPETPVGDSNDIVMIVFRHLQENVLYQKGETFDPTGMLIYVVERDGDVRQLKGEDVKDQFDDHDYDPLDEDGFKDQYSYTVTFTEGTFSEDFQVYVAGGERPLSNKDANFFDWILVIPVAFVMQFFASVFGNNFAIGILLTTIVVRTLAWPIYAKSNDMSIKMNLAQPDMQRVQNKYAAKKDPQSQQQMQMEMMQVYKKHGINVLGCLMPFLQMPIFIAMYGVVRRITLPGGMYTDAVVNTNFLGINLANGNDGIIGMVLAGIVGGTMFLLQRISMKKPAYAKNTGRQNLNPQAQQTEKTMKYVSYFMVIMMAFASYSSNALALYWIFGNIYSLGQTLINRKLNEKKHETLRQKQILG
ncbi:MAG: YidC/Oxa1 family membrane protein insertase [Acholeplasmataceae bacterium]|jgi:YidC/Oxa1 family membrane protein insertase|nr:YidC/Oxa1 family membrane protein insertase [Acholeplasmataceae bacterium]